MYTSSESYRTLVVRPVEDWTLLTEMADQVQYCSINEATNAEIITISTDESELTTSSAFGRQPVSDS